MRTDDTAEIVMPTVFGTVRSTRGGKTTYHAPGCSSLRRAIRNGAPTGDATFERLGTRTTRGCKLCKAETMVANESFIFGWGRVRDPKTGRRIG